MLAHNIICPLLWWSAITVQIKNGMRLLCLWLLIGFKISAPEENKKWQKQRKKVECSHFTVMFVNYSSWPFAREFHPSTSPTVNRNRFEVESAWISVVMDPAVASANHLYYNPNQCYSSAIFARMMFHGDNSNTISGQTILKCIFFIAYKKPLPQKTRKTTNDYIIDV